MKRQRLDEVSWSRGGEVCAIADVFFYPDLRIFVSAQPDGEKREKGFHRVMDSNHNVLFIHSSNLYWGNAEDKKEVDKYWEDFRQSYKWVEAKSRVMAFIDKLFN